MLILPGAPAFSSGRLEKKLAALRARNPEVTAITADHVHFVDADDLSSHERTVLGSLLTYGPHRRSPAIEGARLLVVPRFGTISPWSSKATDIAHICGLASVRRIERGIVYTIAGKLPPRSCGARAPVRPHDRVVCSSPPKTAQLFVHAQPKNVALRVLAALALEQANRELGLALSADEIDYLRESFARARSRPHRRRADDVRAGEHRALPAQDLQRRLRSSTARSSRARCSR